MLHVHKRLRSIILGQERVHKGGEGPSGYYGGIFPLPHLKERWGEGRHKRKARLITTGNLIEILGYNGRTFLHTNNSTV